MGWAGLGVQRQVAEVPVSCTYLRCQAAEQCCLSCTYQSHGFLMAAAPPPCTTCLVPQEVEKQYREGTLKAHIVAVLKAVQPEALTTQGAMCAVPVPRCAAMLAPPRLQLLEQQHVQLALMASAPPTFYFSSAAPGIMQEAGRVHCFPSCGAVS